MVNSIELNGVTFSTDASSAFWLGKVDGLATPTYRTTSMVFSGRDGGMVPDQKYGQRLVTLEGGIDPDNCSDHLGARADLLEAMSFNENVPVTFNLADGRKLQMLAKFEQPNLPIAAVGYTDFQLIAIADDYRLYDTTNGASNSITVSKRVGGGLRWRTGADGNGLRWLTGSGLRWNAGAGVSTATNSGSATAYPVITIQQANQNPIIRNLTTNQQIKINVTTGASDVIVIDTNPSMRSVKLNGGNINALVDGGVIDFELAVGDNLIEFTNDNSSGGYAELEWYDAVLGV